MTRVFDEREFDRLFADARALATQAASHERELVAVVEWLERCSGAAPVVTTSGELAATAASSPALVSLAGLGLRERIRQLCMSARAHRLDAERYLRTLLGHPATSGPDTRRPRVLIVDDAEDVREVLAIALTAAGLEPLTAADGLEALIAAHVARPEAILMDVNMPVLNGIEATRLLRAAPSTRRMPVIAHTAKPDLLALPITRLFDHVVAKPAVPSDVLAALRTFLPAEPGQANQES